MGKKAAYTQLRDGSWGIRVQGTAKDGEIIEVTKKSGEVKDEAIAKVLWTGPDSKTGQTISLCSLVGARSETARRSPGGSREMCAECGRRSGVTMCSDSNGIRALCCSQCSRVPRFERSFT